MKNGNSPKKYLISIMPFAIRKETANKTIDTKYAKNLFGFTSDCLNRLRYSKILAVKMTKNSNAKLYSLTRIADSITKTRTIPVIVRVINFFKGLNLLKVQSLLAQNHGVPIFPNRRLKEMLSRVH